MEFEDLILKIADRLELVSGYKKSIIESELEDFSDDFENAIFQLRIAEHNYDNQIFPKLQKQHIHITEAIGLLFLSYLTYKLRKKFTYGSMWPIISTDLEKYEKINTYFKDNYLFNNHPNPFLTKCIDKACQRFQLRNAFDHRDDEQYIRNTILLQMGLLNKFTKLNQWLSYSTFNQITLKALLNKESDNYSNSFAQGWRVLRRFRDHLIDTTTAKALLKQNSWFKSLDIEDILIAARKPVGTKFLAEDEIENIFFLDQIVYEDNLLKFIINAEDLYALHLSGNDYSVYIDNIYAAKVLRNEDKVLVLDKKIIVQEPTNLSVHLELKNEDGDSVYSDEIILFDLHDQVLIFDEKGNIYKDFSKKLLAKQQYFMLFDSDLDCDISENRQRECFSGYVTLAKNLSKDANCTLSYDGEKLFSLNFDASIEKPIWIDNLVVYAANRSQLNIESTTNFYLKIFDMEDQETPLRDLPSETQIVRWTYANSYVEQEDINNFTASILLSPELICERKHSVLIRYRGQIYHRTIHAAIYDHANKYHLLQRLKDGSVNLINNKPILNYNELVTSKFHLALFNFDKAREPRLLKDKIKYYGKIELNKKFQLPFLPKFGETIIASEHLYYDLGEVLFKVKQQGIIHSYNQANKTIALQSIPEYLHKSEFIVINQDYEIIPLTQNDFEINKSHIVLKEDYLSLVIIYEGNYIGSFVQDTKIDFEKLPDDEEVLKVFYSSYIPLLIMDKTSLIKWIQNHLVTFFKAFMSDSMITPNGQHIYFNFNEIATTLEHLLYDVEFYQDEAKSLLQEIVLHRWTDKIISMPILLIYLLQLTNDSKLINYFLSSLPHEEEPDDRDEQFIFDVINNSMIHLDLGKIDKHNLKIAMHYKYKIFYLYKALRQLQKRIK